jgi:hypothetical protein
VTVGGCGVPDLLIIVARAPAGPFHARTSRSSTEAMPGPVQMSWSCSLVPPAAGVSARAGHRWRL